MPKFSSINKRLTAEERAAPSGPSFGTSTLGGPLYSDAYGAKRAPSPFALVEAYKSIVYACVDINQNAVTRVPLRLYSQSNKGDRPKDASGPRSIRRSTFERLRGLSYLRSIGPTADDVQEITVHPALDSLDEPDPYGYFDRTQLIGLISRYCDVVGLAYLSLDAPGKPDSYLWPLASQYVIPDPRPDGPLIEGYRYFGDYYKFENLLRFRVKPSLRDPYKAGYSPTYAAIEYVGLDDQWVSIQANVLSAGPLPKLAFLPVDPTMPPSDVDRQRFMQMLDMNLARGNAGRPWVSNGAYKPYPLSYSPADLGGLEVPTYILERIANIFGIPVPYLSGDTNLANLQAADTQHARNAVEPRHKAIAATLTRYVRRFDPRLFFAFDSAIAEDEMADAQRMSIMLKDGRVTINQANEESPWEPVPWGDEPWMPGTLVQPSMATEKHQLGIEGQKSQIENAKTATEYQYSDDGDGGGEPDPAAGDDGDAERGSDAALAGRQIDEWLTRTERALGIAP